MENLHIIARLDGKIVGTEDILFGSTLTEIVNDERFTDDDKKQWIKSAFVIERQKLLRDGGLTPEEKKIARMTRQRNSVAVELGYNNFDEMLIDIRKTKDGNV